MKTAVSTEERDGFFVPYRHHEDAAPTGYRALQPIFEAAHPAFRGTLSAIESVRDSLGGIASGAFRPAGERPPRFDQEWFPRLDAAAAYAMVRRGRPRRIVEVGSGHSTRFLCQAVVDGGMATEVVCVDPDPRAPLAGLPVTHVRSSFGPEQAQMAGDLQAGDVLFIDSSHVALPGTDVERLFLDVLPRLPAGTLVHVHDVFLPDGYPAAWARRHYGEQIVVGALLQGGAYEILFASHYVKTRTGMLAESCVSGIAQPATCVESSLWLRKIASLSCG